MRYVGIGGAIVLNSDGTHDLYQTGCNIQGKVFKLMIGSASPVNIASPTVIEKLGLPCTDHPDPYYSYSIYCPDPKNLTPVTKQCEIQFTIGEQYAAKLVFDVMPYAFCDILLGTPWLCSQGEVIMSFKSYTVKHNGRMVTLEYMSDEEIRAADRDASMNLQEEKGAEKETVSVKQEKQAVEEENTKSHVNRETQTPETMLRNMKIKEETVTVKHEKQDVEERSTKGRRHGNKDKRAGRKLNVKIEQEEA